MKAGQAMKLFFEPLKDLKSQNTINLLYSVGWGVLAGYAKHLGAEGNECMSSWGFAGAFSGMVYHGFAYGFGMDIFKAKKKETKKIAAEVAFYGCSIAELIQGMDIPFIENHPEIIGRHFDPLDIAAYGVCIGSAYAIDRSIDYIVDRWRDRRVLGND